MPIDRNREVNRANWDSRVESHMASGMYGLDRFIDDPEFVGEVVTFDSKLMPDLAGKRLLHLQCHIGTDTIGLARLGAEVTGVDLSPKSIEAAQKLSGDSGTPARFLVSELYDTPSVLDETFDVVYTGIGALCWLPDIRGWADVVSGFLDPGGFLFIREAHPVAWALDYERDDDLLVIAYPYFEEPEPMTWVEEESYAGDIPLSSPEIKVWNHGMAEILQALIDAGLRIDRIKEHEGSEWSMGPFRVEGADGQFRLPEGSVRFPAHWSVLATKT